MIVLDTSAVIALLDADDPDHVRVKAALTAERPPFVIAAGSLSEIGYLVERDFGQRAVAGFLDDLAEGRFTFDCGSGDFSRIRALVLRYEDMSLGAADAAVIACAERSGGRVMTLDRRDFEIVGREVPLTLVP
ncbi:MAG TPA: PIN domain-containing protein [Candidatus Sulfomarinibacteraceae bacterium]|nr:PIN domain-containing protein [Candidatus Sulfomarinibacteraceae bacterium]